MSVNSVEKVRLQCGFTRPQMLRVLDVKPLRFAVFTCAEDKLDPIFKTRAADIAEQYKSWEEYVFREIEALGPDAAVVSAVDAAHVLHISVSHLSHLRERGHITAEPYQSKNNSGMFSNSKRSYRVGALKDLVTFNAKAITSVERQTRGPLANSFLFWLNHQPVAA